MTRKKTIRVVAIALVLLSITICAAFVWFGSGQSVSTDNAYVQADITAVAPKVAGYVTQAPVSDNMAVKAGDLLFVIDERDYGAKMEQAKANIQAAEATIANISAAIQLQHAVIRQAGTQVTAAAATQKRAAQEYSRQTRLHHQKATTEQRYEDAQRDKAQADATLAGAQANLEVQNRQLEVLAAQLSSAKAGLAQSQAAYALARLDFEHCRVLAPVDGVIGNRKVRVGRYVTPGMALLDLVPVENVWIVANFKETQLEHIRVGQKVRMVVDAYPGTELTGTVDSLAPGSGSAFSLLPPDNATGNFIRVVQRVPVKITIDDNALEGLLVPGISLRVTVLLGSEKREG